MILAVDPGDTTGLASFYDNGDPYQKWQDNFEGLLETFVNMTPLATDITHILVEDYRLRKGKQAQQTGSRFQAVQVIGLMKYHAKRINAKFELVDVQAKTLGSMYSGVKPPSDHRKSHEIDAYNIGIYWLVANKIIEPPALKDI
jgi:hypothetical protein